ncbi:hypothetical protein [Iamia sp.]|uniref:hypothetical protein n=1 Tax=Iamia sp. TaxID=2722710 RepID=UPI002C7AAB17|nr:hypothetical protein [Iamia sp.]HXH58077.1 hypothetical protein [Iamia sp.]
MAAVLSPRSRVPALALAGWTLLTWITRVPLFVTDEELGVGEKVLSTLPVAVFVVLAAVTAVAVLRRLVRGDTAVRALAGWSLAYWAVRLPLILVNDHPVPFYVVHAVLALVAAALSILALARLSSEGAGPRPAARVGSRSSA